MLKQKITYKDANQRIDKYVKNILVMLHYLLFTNCFAKKM